MTDTPQAPDVIWIDADFNGGFTTFAFARDYFGPGGGPTPEMEVASYTRTDIHAAVVAERDDLREALTVCMGVLNMMGLEKGSVLSDRITAALSKQEGEG